MNTPPIERLTPMMQQYLQVKMQYEDCILFYRLGDFYEMFYDDALTASKVLDITLTGKNDGTEERAPMCGVPFHAVDSYLSKMVEHGYRVAICEQMEDPKEAKGLVKREVIRIVTPGTNMDQQSLDESRNNYLCGIIMLDDGFGISFADVTTGDYMVTEIGGEEQLIDEIWKFEPREIICNDAFLMAGIFTDEMREKMGCSIARREKRCYEEDAARRLLMKHFHVASLDGLGLSGFSTGIMAAGMVMDYLYETQKNELEHILTIHPYLVSRYMMLDTSTRRNLELTETMRDKNKRGSLLWVLDQTKTAMGARLLRSQIEQPLIEKAAIESRLDAVEELGENIITREELREYLNQIYDLERLMTKVSYRSANPRDLIAMKGSLAMLPAIKAVLSDFLVPALAELTEEIDPLTDLHDLLEAAIIDDPPLQMREGGMIKEGYNEEVDHLRQASTEGKTWISELEEREREQSGIKNLRIRYNKVFGYYIEVTNSFRDLVPPTWTRKQTLVNAERYITPELKELEDTILGAEDRLQSLEYNLFSEVRETIAGELPRIARTAKAIAALDVFCSLSVVAEKNNYHRPKINDAGVIDIHDGRHPVVEKMQSASFVANDTFLNQEEDRISIITGPNMAGKSTYMRQTALIVLMAQIGSFVPAAEANIGVCDRVFTRVGASDDLASGQSTFMVEMTEVANILRSATRNSLIILDEIGRGTSTFDGLAIAWSVVEYIADTKLLGAKTLFATHYHELTELEGKLPGVKNFCIAVKEDGEDIVFLRKIVRGGADKSYGIQVARLAGVPDLVLRRARVISEELDNNDILERARAIVSETAAQAGVGIYQTDPAAAHTVVDFLTENHALPDEKTEKRRREKAAKKIDENQFSLFGSSKNEDVIIELRDMQLETLSPIEALNKLYTLQKTIRERT